MFLIEYFGEGGLGVHPNCSHWNTGIRGNKGGLGVHLNCSQYYTGTIRENEEGLGVI